MKSKALRNIFIVICIIFAVICVGLYIYVYTIPSITGSLTETALLTYGNLQSDTDADALIVRTEYTVDAMHSGTLSYYIDESAKTRKFTKILDIYPANGTASNYVCPETGFISYYTDGYEEILNPESIDFINIDDYYVDGKLIDIQPNNTVRNTAASGEYLYKLISSDVWEIVAFVPEEEVAPFSWNSSVKVTINDSVISGTIISMVDTGETWLVVISTKQYFEDFAKLRTVHVEIATEDCEGLIVPNTALAVEDGKVGVYVKNINDEYIFKRVEIVAEGKNESLLTQGTFTEKDENGDEVIINSVEIYDEVLRRPDNSYFTTER